ncbi:unnamed protein product [Oikopleura dioica]|uniref:EF hand associated type-2 domain-containing protein n=1 Tax=Oikopleura dioica TaxID=34765 RepID=E4X1B9_OIKDI|nr:unnamed protein product [Oikopleura dioica]
MGDEVKIVILGDRGVGKTSLILTLVTEEFCSKPPRTVNRIGITSEVSSAGLTYLVDYSEANSEEILEDADVVCLCHNVVDIESLFESVEKWLSIVRLQAYKSPPVIIVGTKSDLIGDSRNEFNSSWNEKCKALMSRYPEVASAIECSSKLNLGVLNVFVDAQKCALYPLCPVFNARSGKLTLEASRALRRIFHIADVNKDDVLDFVEIGELQRKAFNTHLGDQGYEDIRELINSSIQNGVVKQGITIEGFFALQAELCKNLKQEVVWTLLKAFGYTLKFGEVRLELGPILSLRLNPDQKKNSLSKSSLHFLRNCFSKVDAEKEGIIKSERIKKIFSGCERIPREFDLALESTTVSFVAGKPMISMNSWLARWELFMLVDCEKCLSNLILLGAVHGSLGLNHKVSVHVNKVRALSN